MKENLTHDVKNLVCSPDAAAAQTDLDGAIIDMAQDGGFDAIKLTAHIGDATVGAVITLKLMGSANADGSSPAVVAATTAATVAGTELDDKLITLDARAVDGSLYRYVFSRITRTTQNVAINSVTAQLYAPRKAPVTQGADNPVSKFVPLL